MPSLDKLNEVLIYLRLQWVTAGSAEKGHDAGKDDEDRSTVAATKWSGTSPLLSIVSTVQDDGENNAVHPPMTELSWTSHPFCIRRFLMESSLKESRVHKQKRAYLVPVLCKMIKQRY